jgi:mono/diheme cytochrome c family protein
MLLAATTQQSVAFVILLLVLVGGLLWLFATVRRARPEVGAELELAPNRKPFLDDEQLEGAHLERTQLFGLACLVVVAVGLPMYWLGEPGRHEGGIKYFQEHAAGNSIHHGQPVGGEALFAPTAEGGFNCAGCHGGLDGGAAPYTVTDPETGKPLRQVQWKAPALRYVALRMTDDQLREVLTYGRPFSPMPAWGVEGGGPMNPQQINNLIAYLKKSAGVAPYKGAKENAAKAKEDASAAAQKELERMQKLEQTLAESQAKLPTLTDKTEISKLKTTIQSLQTEIALKQDRTYGAALFNLNCARCHTLGYSYGEPQSPGNGAFGPSLLTVLEQFPVEQAHIDFVTNGTKFGEKYGRQGKSSGRMPFFGKVLSGTDIKAIIDYERSLAAKAENK